MTVREVNVKTGKVITRPWTTKEVADHTAGVAQDEAMKTYADKRRDEYPTVEEQLDTIFHSGLEGWKATVQVIKDKYPKPKE